MHEEEENNKLETSDIENEGKEKMVKKKKKTIWDDLDKTLKEYQEYLKKLQQYLRR